MATSKPKGLGRGLEALLGPKLTDAQDAAQTDLADQPEISIPVAAYIALDPAQAPAPEPAPGPAP